MMHRWVCLAVLIAMAGALADAQTPVAPAFEVASIKTNKSGETSGSVRVMPGGRFTAVNVPLTQLVRWASQLPRFQMVNKAEPWTGTDRFDVVARAPEGMFDDEQIRQMVLSLAKDRFSLVTHREPQIQPAFALTVARTDGTLGPRLRHSQVDCTVPPPANAPPRACGIRMNTGQLTSGSATITQLAATLTNLLEQPVSDNTGLRGSYEFDVTFSEQFRRVEAPPEGRASIFTALQEQLGLKLVSQRAPVDVLVIDSARRPTED